MCSSRGWRRPSTDRRFKLEPSPGRLVCRPPRPFPGCKPFTSPLGRATFPGMADTSDAPAALHDAGIDAPWPIAAAPGTALSRPTDDPTAAAPPAQAQRPRPALSFSSRAMTLNPAGLSSTVKAIQQRLAAALCTT